MKTILYLIGGILFAFGARWILQDLNVFHNATAVTGNAFLTVLGSIFAFLGIAAAITGLFLKKKA